MLLATMSKNCDGRTFVGTFGLSDMHGWISKLLPDVPPSVHDSDEVSLAFSHAVLGTQLSCR